MLLNVVRGNIGTREPTFSLSLSPSLSLFLYSYSTREPLALPVYRVKTYDIPQELRTHASSTASSGRERMFAGSVVIWPGGETYGSRDNESLCFHD